MNLNLVFSLKVWWAKLMFKRSSTVWYPGMLPRSANYCIVHSWSPVWLLKHTLSFTSIVTGGLQFCCSRTRIMSLEKNVEYAESCNHFSCLIYCGWFGICNYSETIMLLSCNYLAFTEGKQKCLRESLLKNKKKDQQQEIKGCLGYSPMSFDFRSKCET